MKLEIPTKQLEAALHLAAKKDTRFYLNSVFFDATRMNLVASDGCAIYIGAPGTVSGVEAESFIMPRDFCEAVVKASKSRRQLTVSLDAIETGVTPREYDLHTTSCVGKSIVEVYPDWRRLYPSKCSGEAAVFSAALLTAAGKANKALGAGCESQFNMFLNGERGGVAALFEDQAHVVVMPYKNAKGAIYAAFSV